MHAFQKRKTTQEVKILGRWYSVDFGQDTMAVILRKVQDELENIQDKERVGLSQEQCFLEMLNEEKVILRQAICGILGNSEEVDAIFASDDSTVLLRDIYTFLLEKYMETMKTKSPYDPERIAGL